jgi:hypothetical protein
MRFWTSSKSTVPLGRISPLMASMVKLPPLSPPMILYRTWNRKMEGLVWRYGIHQSDIQQNDIKNSD